MMKYLFLLIDIQDSQDSQDIDIFVIMVVIRRNRILSFHNEFNERIRYCHTSINELVFL